MTFMLMYRTYKSAGGQESFVKDCLAELLRVERATTLPSAAFVVPGRYDLHHHDDGSVGFADLIGAKNYMDGDAE